MADTITLDLALQGGGAHGAFTWGVLDRLLDEERLTCGAISGASAGAMNAVVMANGLLKGGRSGAQRALWAFWKRICREAHRYRATSNSFHALFLPSNVSSFASWPFDPWKGPLAFWQTVTDMITKTYSPYEFNPYNINPLLDVITDSVDFESLAVMELKLFVSATNVKTGALKIFRNKDLTPLAVMASACLPQLFQAVELNGENYWDGGYLGNPALVPLIAESKPADLLIIQLNPPCRSERPRRASDIAARLNEITFNASLMKELRSIALLKQALDAEPVGHQFGHPLFDQLRALRLHRIAADEEAFELSTRSRLDPEWHFLMRLHGLGMRAAENWLKVHWDDVGKRSTLNLDAFG